MTQGIVIAIIGWLGGGACHLGSAIVAASSPPVVFCRLSVNLERLHRPVCGLFQSFISLLVISFLTVALLRQAMSQAMISGGIRLEPTV